MAKVETFKDKCCRFDFNAVKRRNEDQTCENSFAQNYICKK